MLLIKNAKIYTMNKKIFENGFIAVENGKIKLVGHEQDCPDVDSDVEVIDVNGQYVLPGLVDAHCHLGMWEDSVGFEGDDGNEATDPVTPHLRAIDGVYHADRAFEEARQWGITTVVVGPGSANVIGGQFAALKTYGRSVDEMILKQPAAMKIAFGENPKTVYHEKRMSPSTRMATAAILREQFIKAKEYMQAWEEYEKDKDNKDKPEIDMKMEALKLVLEKKLPVKAHVHRTDDILTAIRIAKEFDLDMTLEHCTEGWLIADILKEENIGVIIGPILSERSKVELRNQNIEAAGILSNCGIDIAIMTDHPVIPIQHLILCAAVAVREGMSEEKALEAITINAAKLCRIDDRVGSIEVGKDADFAIFTGEPLDYRTKVSMTIINGKVVFKKK